MNQSERSITKRKNKCQDCPLKLDETLPIINKTKVLKKKKREYKEQNGRPHVQKTK